MSVHTMDGAEGSARTLQDLDESRHRVVPDSGAFSLYDFQVFVASRSLSFFLQFTLVVGPGWPDKCLMSFPESFTFTTKEISKVSFLLST